MSEENEALPTFRALFLFTRACGIAHALREGETLEQIARSYSMDPTQVQLIGMTPIELHGYHAGEIAKLLAALPPEQRAKLLAPYVAEELSGLRLELENARQNSRKHHHEVTELREKLERVARERDELRAENERLRNRKSVERVIEEFTGEKRR